MLVRLRGHNTTVDAGRPRGLSTRLSGCRRLRHSRALVTRLFPHCVRSQSTGATVMQRSPVSSFSRGKYKKCGVGRGGCGERIGNFSRFSGRDLTTSGCVHSPVMSCACVCRAPLNIIIQKVLKTISGGSLFWCIVMIRL